MKNISTTQNIYNPCIKVLFNYCLIRQPLYKQKAAMAYMTVEPRF